MGIFEKFKTKKYLYCWGKIYEPKTGIKVEFNANTVYCKTAEAWILTYQKTTEDIPRIIRIVFVE